jgi:hypothetical protein
LRFRAPLHLGLRFFENYMDRFKEGVHFMPALQLAGIEQFIRVCTFYFFIYKKETAGKTMENNHHFKYS